MLFVITLVLSACNLNKNSNAFDSKKLVGKYKASFIDTEKKGAEGAILSSVSALFTYEFDFYENQKGVMSTPLGAREFSYKVENDSIFHLEYRDEKEVVKGVIRKLGENYDLVQITTETKIICTLTKISE